MALIEDIGPYTEVASHVLQTHTDLEVVALGGIVPTELQATLKKISTMSLAPNQHSGTTATVQTDDLVREVSKFGQILHTQCQIKSIHRVYSPGVHVFSEREEYQRVVTSQECFRLSCKDWST